MKIKVGDLVSVRPHIAETRKSGKMFIPEPEVGIITSRLNGEGYYDVLLAHGKIIFTAYANLEVIK